MGPEHALLHDTGRVSYASVTDAEAVDAYRWLTEKQGIIPALESAHALAYTRKLAARLEADKTIVVCLSGRGDKDLNTVLQFAGATK